MESKQPPCRIAQAIDAMNFKAVGVVDNRAHMESLFEAVGIKFRLVLADNRVFACAFGFDHGERLAIVAKKHIVGITFTGIVRHTGNFHFDAGFSAHNVSFGFENIPTGFTEHDVDKSASSFGFRNITPREACVHHRRFFYLLRLHCGDKRLGSLRRTNNRNILAWMIGRQQFFIKRSK